MGLLDGDGKTFSQRPSPLPLLQPGTVIFSTSFLAYKGSLGRNLHCCPSRFKCSSLALRSTDA